MKLENSKDSPLISVIITNYNYGKFITEAMESVLAQTYLNIELIVINDGSTDNSDKVIKKVISSNPGRNIRYVNRKNKGVVFTRNEGIEIARGEYISYLDADDYFNEDYIRKSYDIAKEFNADVVYPNWHFVGDWLGRPDTDYPEFTTELLQLQELHCTPASLVRKAAIGDIRFVSEKVAEDWDFFIKLSLEGATFKLAKDNYINYRIRQGTRSSKHDPREDTEHFVEILYKHKRIYGDKIINPKRLARRRHPSFLMRLVNNKYTRAAKASVKKDGLKATSIKATRRLVASNKLVRSVFRCLMNAKYTRLSKESFTIEKGTAKLAIVVHLYYPDVWPSIEKKLRNIEEDFDLFISCQKSDEDIEVEPVSKHHKQTYVVALPNRGRDVLPFMFIADKIKRVGVHKYILKLHTKKSLHRKDGSDWLNEMLDELIPNDVTPVLKALKRASTGVVGPGSQVVSLSRYMGGNKERLAMILSKIGVLPSNIDSILANSDKYPFFGGTMFWCRVDFLSDLLNAVSPADFDREKGQVDETTAHAVERIVGMMLHDIEGKKMYTVYGGTVSRVKDGSYTDTYKYVG